MKMQVWGKNATYLIEVLHDGAGAFRLQVQTFYTDRSGKMVVSRSEHTYSGMVGVWHKLRAILKEGLYGR